MTGARGWAGDVGVGIAAAVTFLVAWIAGGSLWEYVNSGDLHGMFLPWYEYVARALWHEGRVPLWQPWQFCGTPVLGLGQTGSLYPPILLLFGVLSSWAALQALYGLHVAILGTGMAAVLRVNGIGRLPAFVGTLIAVTALFRGPLLAGVDHPSFLCAMAWSPWVLFCWQRAATSATTGATRRWTAGVAAASALQWVAGYPDFPLDFAVLLGVVALVMDAGPLRRRVAVAIGGLALGAALAAVQLVPVTEVVAQSIRTEELQLKETMRALFSVFSLWQLGWAARNVWGIAAIALAVAAVVRPDRRRIAWATAFVWSVFALNRPFAWLYVLPPWDGVRFPFGWGGGVAVFLGLLAAAGIATTAAARASWVRAAGILLAVVAAGESIVVVRNSPSALPAFSPRNEGYRVPDVPDAAGRARLLAEAAGDGRALSERDGRAGNALRYRVRLVQGHEPSVLPRRIVHLLTAGGLYDNLGIFRDRDWRPLAERPGLAALLGVGAVGIAPRRSAALEGAGFARIGTLPGDDLLLYRAAPSRARLVHRSEVVPGGEAGSLAAVLAHPEGRLDVVVLEEGGTHPPLAEPPAGASESARLVVDEPERVVVEATAAAPALLVFGDTAYPGWQADVDGTVAPILIADHAFRAVFVPPGRHTVTFVYAPRAVRVGLGVTLAATVVLLALLVIPARRRV